MSRPNVRGFSMVELVIVLLLLGMMIAMAVPTVSGFRSSHMVKIAKENIAGQIRLAREKAIGTGTTQTIRFQAGQYGYDYYIWNGSQANPGWKLPKGIAYLWVTGTQDSFRLTRDGRCQDSGMIIVQDSRGVRDTVSVQRSGLVLSD